MYVCVCASCTRVVGREGYVCGESLLMRYASIAMVAGGSGGGGGVVVGVVGERDDDLF